MEKEEIKEKIEKIKRAVNEKKEKREEIKTEEKKSEQKIDEKDKDLIEKNEKIVELTDMLQRLQAETENYKKRCDRETADFREYSKAELVYNLLPILDSFELALKNIHNKEEFIKGVELIYSQLYDMLEKEGLKHIKALGERFDPYRHEILLTEKTDKEEEEDLIVEELQKGYTFKNRILRYTKVKVHKK